MCEYTEKGIGICTTDLCLNLTNEKLMNLVKILPNDLKHSFSNFIFDAKIDDPLIDPQFLLEIWGNQENESAGLACLIKQAAEEEYSIKLFLEDDIYGFDYLLYKPSYPWNMTGSEKYLTKENIENLFFHFIKPLGFDKNEIKEYEIEH